ncbi:MAG: GNAT family N-acetyltransferase [Anditalea sp.]
MTGIQIVDFTPTFRQAFKDLNEAWIKKYFELEDEDIKTLNHPDKIIHDGGFIFVALRDAEAVGVCTLRKVSAGTYEFSKMAVAEKAQGLGIGRKLAEAAIAKAKQVQAKRIYLEGNTLLEASIHLYRKLGFKEVSGQHSHYKRVNIIMEMVLV